jgi:cell division transport system permease protein
MAERRRGGKPLRRTGAAIRIWLGHHGRNALASLGELARAPFASVLTVAVVAIALALPAGLHLAARNLAAVAEGWQEGAALSLFLAPETTDARAKALAQTLASRADLSKVRLVTPAEGLAELREYGGLAGAVDLLLDNPLPIVLAVEPVPALATNPAGLEALRDALAALPGVEAARLDTAWVQRLNALISFGAGATALLAGLLAVAVLLVVGNTLRLELANRREEVALLALVGATQAFVRRPFLYTGAWYGLLGGLAAAIIVTLAVTLAQAPVKQFAALYGAEFPLVGLDPGALLALLVGGPLLGLAGAWMAVRSHLASCAPR